MSADALRHLELGDHRLPCPECNKSSRDRALSVIVKYDGGVWICHRCGYAGGWRNKDAHRMKPTPATPEVNLTLAANYREYWRSLQPVHGKARAYLEARGCAIPPADGDLRSTESLRHPSGHIGPGLVALVTDAITREPMTLHKTWVNADGTKASVDPPRLFLGKHRKQGGVIRLWPDDAVTTGLAITEGIETALAVALAFQPVWSAMDAGNLSAFAVLEGIESLLIVADHDPAGLEATDACAKRWHASGREVRIAIPPPGKDAADLARAA